MDKRGFNKNDERDFGTFKIVVDQFITANKNKKDAAGIYDRIKSNTFFQTLAGINIFNVEYHDLYDMTKFLHKTLEEMIKLLDEHDRNVDNDYYIIDLLETFLKTTDISLGLICFPSIINEANTYDINETVDYNIIKLIVMLCSISMVKFDDMKKIKDKTKEYYENQRIIERISKLSGASQDDRFKADLDYQLDEATTKDGTLLKELDNLEAGLSELEEQAFLQCLGEMEDDKKTQLFNKISVAKCVLVDKNKSNVVRLPKRGDELLQVDILKIYEIFLAKYKEMHTNNTLGNNTIKPLLAAFRLIIKHRIKPDVAVEEILEIKKTNFFTRQKNTVRRFFTPAPSNGGSINKTKKQKTKKNHSKSKKSRKNKTRR